MDQDGRRYDCEMCKRMFPYNSRKYSFGTPGGRYSHMYQVHSIRDYDEANNINRTSGPLPQPEEESIAVPQPEEESIAVPNNRVAADNPHEQSRVTRAQTAAAQPEVESESTSDSGSESTFHFPAGEDDLEQSTDDNSTVAIPTQIWVESDIDPSHIGVPYDRSIIDQASSNIVFKYDQTMAKLYQTCDFAGAPKYLCDKIIGILREEIRNGFDIHSGAVTQRKAFFKRVYKGLNVKPPDEVKVQLDHGSVVTVFRFDFKEQLQHHLLSLPYANMGNIDLPQSSAWESAASPQSSAKHTSVIDSTWFYESCGKYADLLCTGQYCVNPLLLYIDKTGTDKIQKASLEPLVCISANLNQQTRQNTLNWFIIGYIPNLELSSSAKRRKFTKSNAVDYHRCLKVLLDPLQQMQRENPVMKFRRGKQVCAYRIICPIASIIGDNLSQDKLCGKIAARGQTSIRMTRSCLTSHCDSDSVPHLCHRMPTWLWHKTNMAALSVTHSKLPVANTTNMPTEIEVDALTDEVSPNLARWIQFVRNWKPTSTPRLVTDDLLNLRTLRQGIAQEVLSGCLGSHTLVNAFDGVDFGLNSCIHTATMSDIMHAVEEGIVPYLTDILLSPLADLEKTALDHLVEQMFSTNGSNRSGERDEYPRVSFRKGFSSLTNISADEHVGQLFVISILLHTKRGKSLLTNRFTDDFDERRAARVEASKGTHKKRRTHSEDKNDYCDPTEVQTDDREREPCIPRPKRTPAKYKPAEIRRLTEKLDLKFLLDHNNHLPPTLREKLNSILATKLKPSARLNKLLVLQGTLFPSGLLDYQPVDELPPPPPAWPGIVTDTRARGRIRTPDIEEMRTECTIKMNQEQFTLWLESFLAFHAFLKYGSAMFEDKDNIRDYHTAYARLMATLVSCFSRGPGTNEFKLQKLLECAHFIKDHLMHGPPVAHNTDTGERGLKRWAKAPAKTAQNRGDTEFKRQVCRNVTESNTLRLILCKELAMGKTVATTTDTQAPGGGFAARGRLLKFMKNNGRGGVFPTRGGKGVPKYHLKFPEQVKSWFDKSFKDGSGEIQLVTEMTLGLDTPTPELIRAHPDYNSEGPWYDFVEVDYGERGKFPARCACFFEWPSWGDPVAVGIEGDVEVGRLMVLIHECGYPTEKNLRMTSKLYTHHTLQSVIDHSARKRVPKFKCVDAETLSGRLYVIDPTPENGGIFWKTKKTESGREDDRTNYVQFEIIQVKDRKTYWPGEFLSTAIG